MALIIRTVKTLSLPPEKYTIRNITYSFIDFHTLPNIFHQSKVSDRYKILTFVCSHMGIQIIQIISKF